jgi:cytochrome b pre-mRNA-processing protein 3
MNKEYLNFYNNLVKLTTNKSLYKDLIDNKDTFSDRLSLFLLHFAFILKEFKNDKNENELQELYDFNFRQLELTIREIGYGDQSINKKMKDYINLFHGIISEIHFWDDMKFDKKNGCLSKFLQNSKNII